MEPQGVGASALIGQQQCCCKEPQGTPGLLGAAGWLIGVGARTYHGVLHHGPVALVEAVHAGVALAGGPSTQKLHLARHRQPRHILL